ncbi:glucoside xylosyltransferase 2-like [Hyalella azteca]|uniref:UDP-D-xylose:beta-D-glucoside alpha-1,3-D-xylosyltransferase n=1 Tax=Hyalella azteca TaxID=294128 RepID=A0A979FGM0_HYAAZ|nr:glucoside xylosyltransferase 2-like [Hyalella azteca]
MFHRRGSVKRISISKLCYVLAIGGTIFVFLQLYLDLIERKSAGYSAYRRIIRKEAISEDSEGDLLNVNDELLIETRNTIASYSKPMIPIEEVVAAIILCEADETKPYKGSISSFEQHIDRAKSLLKSIVFLSQQHIKLHVLVNSNEVIRGITSVVEFWPPQQRNKIALKFRKVSSQSTLGVEEKTRVTCVSKKLIFEKMYPEEDALIYLDTDIVFLRPIEDLWRVFKNFNDEQLFGAVTPLWRIFNDKPFTEFEKMVNFAGRGFNAGLLLLNLTRIRSQAEKWQAALQSALEVVAFNEQSLFNLMMNLNPEHFYEMDCEWNFRLGLCTNVTHRCPGLVANGVHAVHGNGGAFFKDRNVVLKILHEYWRDLDMSKSLNNVISELNAILPDAVLKTPPCDLVEGLHEMLMKHMKLLDGKLDN